MAHRAIIFLRRKGNLGVGHVGWAFEYPDGDWNVGSVENPCGSVYTPPSRIGWWARREREPFDAMRERDYTEYKLIHLDQGDTGAAEARAEEVGRKPYELVHANCEDDTYHVLTAYGARLPHPSQVTNWTPVAWFAHVPGDACPLADAPSRA
jgi:hypothetical protein